MALVLLRRSLGLARRACRSLTTPSYTTPTVELLYDAQAKLAGAPFYDAETNELLWVDKCSRTLNFLNVDTKQNRVVEMPETIGGAVAVAGSDKVAVLIGRRIVLVNRSTGSTVKDLTTVDHLESPTTKLNAAKCDRLGRVWCGTIGPKYWSLDAASTMGALYSFAAVKGNLRRYITGISIMNGIEWHEDYNRMYVVDTIPKKVYSFHYDEVRGELGAQRVMVDYSIDDKLGHPHGICKDANNNVWVTGFMGGHITCWDCTGGEMLHQFPLPTLRPTACCFGGPNYEHLYITSGKINTPEEEMNEYPQTGGIFIIKNLGVQGLPQHKLRIQPIKMSVGY